ncbi:unnamed protein product [Amoebophrya sp. A120]|nr:unnamed protein product [Amoebophrya sp. A120]|eukprot:GSA120T00018737001.1
MLECQPCSPSRYFHKIFFLVSQQLFSILHFSSFLPHFFFLPSGTEAALPYLRRRTALSRQLQLRQLEALYGWRPLSSAIGGARSSTARTSAATTTTTVPSSSASSGVVETGSSSSDLDAVPDTDAASAPSSQVATAANRVDPVPTSLQNAANDVFDSTTGAVFDEANLLRALADSDWWMYQFLVRGHILPDENNALPARGPEGTPPTIGAGAPTSDDVPAVREPLTATTPTPAPVVLPLQERPRSAAAFAGSSTAGAAAAALPTSSSRARHTQPPARTASTTPRRTIPLARSNPISRHLTAVEQEMADLIAANNLVNRNLEELERSFLHNAAVRRNNGTIMPQRPPETNNPDLDIRMLARQIDHPNPGAANTHLDSSSASLSVSTMSSSTFPTSRASSPPPASFLSAVEDSENAGTRETRRYHDGGSDLAIARSMGIDTTAAAALGEGGSSSSTVVPMEIDNSLPTTSSTSPSSTSPAYTSPSSTSPAQEEPERILQNDSTAENHRFPANAIQHSVLPPFPLPLAVLDSVQSARTAAGQPSTSSTRTSPGLLRRNSSTGQACAKLMDKICSPVKGRRQSRTWMNNNISSSSGSGRSTTDIASTVDQDDSSPLSTASSTTAGNSTTSEVEDASPASSWEADRSVTAVSRGQESASLPSSSTPQLELPPNASPSDDFYDSQNSLLPVGIPDRFCCPITLVPMKEPVAALGDTYSYERWALKEHLRKNGKWKIHGDEFVYEGRPPIPGNHARITYQPKVVEGCFVGCFGCFWNAVVPGQVVRRNQKLQKEIRQFFREHPELVEEEDELEAWIRQRALDDLPRV